MRRPLLQLMNKSLLILTLISMLATGCGAKHPTDLAKDTNKRATRTLSVSQNTRANVETAIARVFAITASSYVNSFYFNFLIFKMNEQLRLDRSKNPIHPPLDPTVFRIFKAIGGMGEYPCLVPKEMIYELPQYCNSAEFDAHVDRTSGDIPEFPPEFLDYYAQTFAKMHLRIQDDCNSQEKTGVVLTQETTDWDLCLDTEILQRVPAERLMSHLLTEILFNYAKVSGQQDAEADFLKEQFAQYLDENYPPAALAAMPVAFDRFTDQMKELILKLGAVKTAEDIPAAFSTLTQIQSLFERAPEWSDPYFLYLGLGEYSLTGTTLLTLSMTEFLSATLTLQKEFGPNSKKPKIELAP